MEFTDTFEVYAPRFVVGQDTNLVPAAVDPVGTLSGNLQQGTKSAQDTATRLGIVDRQSSVIYFPVGSEASLGDRYVLKDTRGALWLLRSGPVVRNRFPSTAHVWVFCTSINIPPAGIT